MFVKALVVLAVFLLETSEASSCSNANCGLRKSSPHNDLYRRIVGGGKAKPGSWPWQVEILRRDDDTNKYTHRCGGVLIDDQWVVSVASCTFEYPYAGYYKVVLGQTKQTEVTGTEQNQYVHDVEYFISHELYTSVPFNFDIALFKLAKPVKLKRGKIWPVCLSGRFDKDKGSSRKKCYMTGWGFTSINSNRYSDDLQEAEMAFIDHDTCAWKNLSKDSKVDKKTMFCAGGVTKSQASSCRGDGGGPFVCEESGRWVLRGVTSWGHKECRKLSVFTRISAFLDWIY